MIYIYLGIVITAVLIIVFKLNKSKKEMMLIKRNIEQLNTLKENADRIKIDLKKVILKSNNWSEEVVANNSESGGLNQISGRGDLNVEKVQHHQNVLLFRVPYKNIVIEFDYAFNMEITTLEMKLAIQKETILYVNPNNFDEYFLDLEFLK